jgi:hypothetical protein
MPYYAHAYDMRGAPYFTGPAGTVPGWNDLAVKAKDPIKPADLDAYFTTSLSGAAWAALDKATQEAALAEAERWLATLCWKPDGCCGRDFEAAYLMAVAELALALGNAPTALTGGLGDGRWVKREKLDVLEQEFGLLSEADGIAAPGSKYPLIIQRFPWLKDILGCWLQMGPQRSIRLYRN